MPGSLVMRLLNILCSFSNTGVIRAGPAGKFRNKTFLEDRRFSLNIDSKS